MITLTAQTKNNQEWDGTAANALLNHTDGQFNETFMNNAGSNLPETGGMGTVLLYVAGIAVFVLAGATLVMALRRRNA